MILGHTEEASSEVLGRLDHAVHGLGAEDGEGAGGSEVVEELAIELAVGDTEVEVLAPAKGSEQLRTELVRPLGQERELAGDAEAAVLGSVLELLGEGRRGGPGGRVAGTVAVQEVHLDDVAAIGNQRAGIGQAVVGRGHGVPRRQVSPVLGDVELRVKFAAAPRLWRDQRELTRGPVVIRIEWRGLDGRRLLAGRRRARVADLGLRREQHRVDRC